MNVKTPSKNQVLTLHMTDREVWSCLDPQLVGVCFKHKEFRKDLIGFRQARYDGYNEEANAFYNPVRVYLANHFIYKIQGASENNQQPKAILQIVKNDRPVDVDLSESTLIFDEDKNRLIHTRIAPCVQQSKKEKLQNLPQYFHSHTAHFLPPGQFFEFYRQSEDIVNRSYEALTSALSNKPYGADIKKDLEAHYCNRQVFFRDLNSYKY